MNELQIKLARRRTLNGEIDSIDSPKATSSLERVGKVAPIDASVAALKVDRTKPETHTNDAQTSFLSGKDYLNNITSVAVATELLQRDLIPPSADELVDANKNSSLMYSQETATQVLGSTSEHGAFILLNTKASTSSSSAEILPEFTSDLKSISSATCSDIKVQMQKDVNDDVDISIITQNEDELELVNNNGKRESARSIPEGHTFKDITIPIQSAHLHLLDSQGHVRLHTAAVMEGLVVAINGCPIPELKRELSPAGSAGPVCAEMGLTRRVLSLLKAADVFSITMQIPQQAEPTVVSSLNAATTAEETNLTETLVFASVPKGIPLGVSVAPLHVNVDACGGLYVMQVEQSLQTSMASFEKGDILVSVNGMSITSMSTSQARQYLDPQLSRRVTLVRKQAVSAASLGSLDTAIQETVSMSSSTPTDQQSKENLSNAARPDANVNDNGKHKRRLTDDNNSEDVEKIEGTSIAWHAMKKRLASRSLGGLYALGYPVAVDRTRQCPPTLMADEYEVIMRGSRSRADPLLSTLHNMRRRSAENPLDENENN